MAHREIDYSKMADKYESRYSGKNLDSPRVFSSRPYSLRRSLHLYNKKYDTVKILHYDLNGYVIYQKSI